MATRAPVDQNLLADLVERRLETPDVEYKNFMPLTEAVERANVARHICALANAGGGWLVFGFEDDGTPAEPHPGDLSVYRQDQINGIGARYLEPQPNCEVYFVTASSGLEYPAVRVPSAGSVPVCAKASGPQDERRRPQGIVKGTHYVRAQGPASVPIDSPELWRDVLRRCVLAERSALLASIGQLFDGPRPAAEAGSPLPSLVDFSAERWIAGVSESADWPVPVAVNRVLFGFRLTDDEGTPPAPLPLNVLDRALREASNASADVSRAGGEGAFLRGHSGESRPGVILVQGREGYAARQAAEGARYVLPFEWFVRDDGAGVEATGIAEDNPWVVETIAQRRSRAWPAGERLAPSFQVAMTAERVAFVGALTPAYPAATRCELVVDYLGLAGRHLDETAAGAYFSIDRSSREDARRVAIEVGVASLTAELPEVVAALIGPIFRLFEWDVGPDYVRSVLARGRR